MLKKIFITVLFGLILTDLGFAQDPNPTTNAMSSGAPHINSDFPNDPSRVQFIETTENGIPVQLNGRPAVIVNDQRGPWRSNTEIVIKFDGLPNNITGCMEYDAIIYPTNRYGASEYFKSLRAFPGNKSLSEPVTRNSVPVQTEWLPEYLEARNFTYEQRYMLVEKFVKNALIQAYSNIKNHDASAIEGARIAIASFHHPVHFPNAKAVAFFMMAGADEAIKTYGNKTPIEITFLSNKNIEVKEALELEIAERTVIAREIDGSMPENMQKNRNVFFYVQKSPDLIAEKAYFLKHVDYLLKNGGIPYQGLNLGVEDFTKILLDPKQTLKDIVPPTMIESIRIMSETVYLKGQFNIDIVRANLERSLEQEYTETKGDKQTYITERADKIMSELTNQSRGPAMKFLVYYQIMKSKSSMDKINRAMEWMMKK